MVYLIKNESFILFIYNITFKMWLGTNARLPTVLGNRVQLFCMKPFLPFPLSSPSSYLYFLVILKPCAWSHCTSDFLTPSTPLKCCLPFFSYLLQFPFIVFLNGAEILYLCWYVSYFCSSIHVKYHWARNAA